jgi:hypothetical protein
MHEEFWGEGEIIGKRTPAHQDGEERQNYSGI